MKTKETTLWVFTFLFGLGTFIYMLSGYYFQSITFLAAFLISMPLFLPNFKKLHSIKGFKRFVITCIPFIVLIVGSSVVALEYNRKAGVSSVSNSQLLLAYLGLLWYPLAFYLIFYIVKKVRNRKWKTTRQSKLI